jgi:hypothetical protein
MQTYMERAAQVALDSQIAVMVFLNPDNEDSLILPVRPCMAANNELPSLEEYTRRQFRPVAVVGLAGLKPLAAFKEPLPTEVVTAISAAFLEYVRVLIGDTFMQQIEAAEIAELERLWVSSYSDPSAPIPEA